MSRLFLPSVLAWSICLVGLASHPHAKSCFAADEAQFDVPPVVACRDITTADFQLHNPGQRLWEAKLSVSVLARKAAEGRITQLLVRIDNPRRALRVVDYAPHTALTTEVQGVVRREHHAESTRSFDFHLKGGVPGIGEGAASGSARDRKTTDEHYERLPPLKLSVASGTTQRGSGVYFKLKPTPRTTLEGSHDFTLWFAAAETWSGDHLRVRCEAFAREPALVPSLDESVPWGDQDFVTALYRSGDEAGRAAAESLVRAEGNLRWAVAQNRRSLAEKREGDVVKELTTLWSGRDTRLPSGWFELLVYGPPDAAQVTVARLPTPVRTAAERYLTAKRRLTAEKADYTVAKIERLPPVD